MHLAEKDPGEKSELEMQLFRAREYIQKNRRVLKKLGNSTEEVLSPWRYNAEV